MRPRILRGVLHGNLRKAPVTTTEPSSAAAANLTRAAHLCNDEERERRHAEL
jgi:hypothetical protein